MGRRSGFTLVEILLVVVIMGVMTLMAYPRANSAMVKSNLRGGRTRVVNMLSMARAAATQGGRTMAYVKFNGNNAVVTATPRRNLPIGANTEDTLGVVVNLSTVYGATLTAGAAQIAFDRAASPAACPAGPAKLTRSYADSVYVDMLGGSPSEALTGRVHAGRSPHRGHGARCRHHRAGGLVGHGDADDQPGSMSTRAAQARNSGSRHCACSPIRPPRTARRGSSPTAARPTTRSG